MKRKFVQIAALAVILILLATGSLANTVPAGTAGTSSSDGTVIRVGLYYNSTALDGANLLNSVGSGYRFGYYDSSNQFVELANTAETAVSVVKTQNVGYGTYNGYLSYHTALAKTADVVVGSSHLQLPESYASFEDAQAEASKYEDGFVAYIDGTYYVRLGSYQTTAAAEAAIEERELDAEAKGTSSYGVSVVVTGTNRIVFQYDDNGSGTGLGVRPNKTDGGAQYVTWFKGYKWYGGFRYERIGGGSLTVVNLVGLEDYVKGVIPYEMSASWPVEALKAGAVCARTYVLANLNKYNSSYHFDVDNTSLCQVYRGPGSASSNSDAAVDATAGVTAKYNDKYILCVYYSSNGGASMDSSVIWGGNQSSYPYLVGVVDPYEAAITIPNYTQTVTLTGSELAEKLRDKGYTAADIVSVKISASTTAGLPKTVTFTDSAGKNYTLTTVKVKSMLGLRSYNYSFSSSATGGGELSINGTTTVDSTDGLYAIDGGGKTSAIEGNAYVITGSGVEQTGEGSGSVTITVTCKGWGHNVGMSQYGAYAMAKQGYTYDQILKFYYTGITVG